MTGLPSVLLSIAQIVRDVYPRFLNRVTEVEERIQFRVANSSAFRDMMDKMLKNPAAGGMGTLGR